MPSVPEPSESVLQLPVLRDDLRLQRGAPSVTGHQTWVIEDPVRQRFFQINEDAFQLLSLWSAGTNDELANAVSREFGRAVDEGEIEALVQFVYANALSDASVRETYEDYIEQRNSSERGLMSTAVHSYLFFQVPLVRPNRFLQATLPIAKLFMGRAALTLVLLMSVAGLYLVSRQWDGFASSFMHFFSLEGMIFYGLSLIFIKSLHELGHAYVATRFGVRVSTMGIAFLVMFPVLYTDVSDAWKLTSRRQRVAIDAAGIIVELAVAGLATLAWALLPDGALKSCAFVLATTSWMLSLLVNLNPFMRFDGYHLLADGIGVSNLQTRSFEFAKWRIREALFGFGAPAPEVLSDRLRVFLIGYAISVWVYRFFLFLGIALLVYTFFFKVLGVALFVVEILWFIILPVAREVQTWWGMRSLMRWNRQAVTGALCVAVLLCALFVPLPHSVSIPAVLRAQEDVKLYPVRASWVSDVRAADGLAVSKGEVLFDLESPDLEQHIELAQQRLELVKARRSRAAGDKSELSQFLVLQRQLVAEQSALAGLLEEKRLLQVRAPMDGVVVDLSGEIHPGRAVRVSDRLGIVRSSAARRVVGYTDDDSLARIAVGKKGRFIPDNAEFATVDVTLTGIGAAGSRGVDVPFLASVYGGAIAVEPEANGRLRPVKAQYQVDMDVVHSGRAPDQVTRGVVVVRGASEMLAVLMWRQVMKVLIREASA